MVVVGRRGVVLPLLLLLLERIVIAATTTSSQVRFGFKTPFLLKAEITCVGR